MERKRPISDEQFQVFLSLYRVETPSYASFPGMPFMKKTGLDNSDAQTLLKAACEGFQKIASRRMVQDGDPATVIFEASLKEIVDVHLNKTFRRWLTRQQNNKTRSHPKRVAIPVTDDHLAAIDKFAADNNISRSRAFEDFIGENLTRWLESKQKPVSRPAVAIEQSITDEYLICLENGKRVKELRGYLKRMFDMTFEEYSAKWNLPDGYPTMAPAYARKRASLGGAMGLKADIRKAIKKPNR